MGVVNIVISRSSLGISIKDILTEDEYGLKHGEITNNSSTLEKVLYIRHDSLNPITDFKLYVEDLAELIEWGDSDDSKGLLIDTNNDGTFNLNFKTGQGDSVVNGINIGNIDVGLEKVIRIKIAVPGLEDTSGVRKFNLKYGYDYTP